MKLVPLGLACLTILWQLASQNNSERDQESKDALTFSVLTTIPLLMLSAVTVLLHGRLSSAVSGGSGERRSSLTFGIVTMAGGISAAGVLAMWLVVSEL